jgi:hypothetical protein
VQNGTSKRKLQHHTIPKQKQQKRKQEQQQQHSKTQRGAVKMAKEEMS